MPTNTAPTVATRKFAARMLAGLLVTTAIWSPALVNAQAVWTGAIDDDPTNPGNWAPAVVPGPTTTVIINVTGAAPQPVLSGAGTVANAQTVFVGETNTGSLIVRDGAVFNIGQNVTTAQRGLIVGGGNDSDASRFADGTLTITGAGSRVDTFALTLGRGASTSGLASGGASGLVEVLNGGTLRVTIATVIGASVNSANIANSGRGVLRVSGAGSTLDIAQPDGSNINIQNPGSRLEVLDGARLIGAANWTVRTGAGVRVSGQGTDASFGNSITVQTRNADFSDAGLLVENGGILRVNVLASSGPGPTGGRVLVRSGGQILASSVFVDGTQIEVDGGTLSGTSIIRLENELGSRLILRNGASVNAGTLTTFSANAEIFFGGLDTDAPSALGAYNVGNLGIAANGRALFNHTGSPLTVNSNIGGGGLIQHIAGTTILTGTMGSFGGETRLTGGTIRINGDFGSASHMMSVSSGATLGGSGILRGNLSVADGRIAPGNGVGNLRIIGNVVLGASSFLDYELGAPSGVAGVGSDLITLTGNLTLEGTLNVANTGGFGAGLYRLINYTGTLTNNGLVVGTTPTGFSASDLMVQTSVANQVNLLVGTPQAPGIFSFWDGANTAANGVVDGGTGTWNRIGTNWTEADGMPNGPYDPASLLIFAGTGGTVTVDNGPGQVIVRDTNQLAPLGLQFASTGYNVVGGPIAFDGIATIRVGDGTTAGAAITATIASNLTGAGRIDKTDLGTLVLTGTNTFAARSRVQGGTLEIAGGGRFNTNGLEVALVGPATLRVTGAGSIADVGTGIRTGFVNNFAGTVEVLNGGTLRDSAFGGHNFGANSVVRVSGAGSLLSLAQVSLSQGLLLVENGGLANVTPFSFSPTGSLIVRSGGRIETTGGDGNWVVPNGLIQGAGSSFTSNRVLSIAPATSSNPGARFIVEDGATVTVNANTDSGLGFEGPISTLDVRRGASFTLTGGSGAGLQIENSRLTVDNASFSIGGTLLGGQRFGNNTVVLRNADFTAREIALRAATDRIVIGGDAGEAATGAGRFNVGQVSLSNAATSLILNHNSTGFTIASEFQGSGVIRHLAGDTRLTGSSQSFGGATELTGGSLAIDGVFGGAAHRMNISGGATLSGGGTIGGVVTVGEGTIRPGGEDLAQAADRTIAMAAGDTIGTLTFTGQLNLGAASRLAYQLGAPTGVAGEDSDLINVTGNLVLDGTLDVMDAGGFGAGLYRIINYGGTLTDNGLGIGMVPMGFSPDDLTVQTSVANQVNLLVGAPVRSFNFWDGGNTVANGTVDGGTGTWTATGNNWTTMDGLRNGAYDPEALLIFAGTGGTVTIDNTAGAVFLGTGAQFAANGYRVTGGALRLDAASTTFRVGDGTTAGAGITTTIDSVLSGAGGLDKTDLGTLVLTAANTYTGGTNVTGGVLRGNTVSVSGPVAVGSSGTLQFDQSADGSYAGTLTGGGTVRKTGTGILSITGASNAFAGTTRIEAGTLAAIGMLGGNVQVQSAAALIGNGRVGALDVSGRVAPTGTGTLNVTGDVIFRTGSIFAVDLLAAGGADRITAGGRATLEGGTVAVTTFDPQASYTDGSVFRILNAVGGLTGTFAGLSEQSEFLDFVLGYDATGASITVRQVRLFPDVAATYNQRQAAGSLMNLVRPAGSDALAVYNALLLLDGDAARAAFDASSGEIYATTIGARQRQGMALASQFITRSQAGIEEGLGIWGGVTGRTGHVSGDGNGARFSSDAVGGEIGVDYRGPDNGWAMGIGGGWLTGDVRVAGRGSNAAVDEWHLGGYVRYGTGAEGFTAAASVVHARADADVTRTIAFGPIERTAQAETKVNTTTIAADLRYGIAAGDWAFGPAVSVETSKSSLGAFRETGANALDLFASRNSDAWTRVGAGGFARFASKKGYVDLTARYVTGERNDADVNLGMAGSTGPFNVRAPVGAKSGAAVQASGQYDLGGNWSIAGQIGATGGSGDASVDGNLRLSLAF